MASIHLRGVSGLQRARYCQAGRDSGEGRASHRRLVASVSDGCRRCFFVAGSTQSSNSLVMLNVLALLREALVAEMHGPTPTAIPTPTTTKGLHAAAQPRSSTFP